MNLDLLRRFLSPRTPSYPAARRRGRSGAALCALGAVLGLAIMGPAAVAQSLAATQPQPGPGDPRIRQVLYDPNQVVQLRARLGFEMTVEFDPEERIENVSIGDSLSWQATPSHKGTLLFLKPMAKSAPTSMTVVTSKRLYSFLLSISDNPSPNDAQAMLRVRFLFPPPPKPLVAPAPAKPAQTSTDQFSFAYAFTGAKQLTPARVFDDGKATFFEFTDDKDVPAVFVLGPDGKEEMANSRVTGRYTVVDFTAPTFILRYGKAKLEVKNTAWREPGRPKSSAPGKGG